MHLIVINELLGDISCHYGTVKDPILVCNLITLLILWENGQMSNYFCDSAEWYKLCN